MTTRKQQGATAQGQDAIALLTDDHIKVQKLFKEFEKLKEEEDEERRQQLDTMICAELTIHAQIEEEIFYPAARDAVDNEDLLDVAEVELVKTKNHNKQKTTKKPNDELFDAKVTVLGEFVNHHVKEE